MPRLTFTVSHENEILLKEKKRRRGDISCIINDALDQYFKNPEK
ncbi:MAG TPA: hypothetical protein VF350_04505 [Candidatus Bathyarchaeia archaeon]